MMLLAAAALVTITLDYTSGDRTLAVLTNPKATREDASALLELPGVKAEIKHAAGFMPNATPEVFVTTLVAAAHGETPSPDPFGWKGVLTNVDGARAVVAAIQKDPDAFVKDVAARIAAYTPPDLTISPKVYVIAGGGSDGFTQGGSDFYLAADMFRGELDAAKLMTTHELYHVAQAGMRAKLPARREGLVPDLLQSVVNEGTADYVADPLKIKGGGSWMEWYRGKYQRNLDRIDLNFALLDTLLYRAIHDPKATANMIYPIGFSGRFDSPGYFVGYRMASVIDSRIGRARLIELVGSDPREFFRAYLSVASADDPHFSEATSVVFAPSSPPR